MLFIANKYTNIYYSIINSAKSQDRTKSKENYFECHHIVPRCLGGNDSKDNLVLLTAREHFICHCLLVKMVDRNSEGYHKLLSAAICMKQNPIGKRYINSRLYETVKREYSISQSKRMQTDLNPNKGKPRTEDFKNKIRNSFLLRYGMKIKFNKVSKYYKTGRINLLPKSNKIKADNKKPRSKIKTKFNKVCRTKMPQDILILEKFGYRLIRDHETQVQNIRILLNTEYHINNLSLPKIMKKYDIKYIRGLELLFIKLEIPRRSASESHKV